MTGATLPAHPTRRRWSIALMAIVLAVALVASCSVAGERARGGRSPVAGGGRRTTSTEPPSTDVTTTEDRSTTTEPPITTDHPSTTADISSGGVTIKGDDGGPTNTIVRKTIIDLQAWWSSEMRDVYGKDYQPVEGGFYSVDPRSGDLPPCATDVEEIDGNAFYCPRRDVVAWDNAGLMPALRQKFGDFSVAVVLAHEWGHAIQARVGFRAARTVTREMQADCFAGAWVAHVKNDGGISLPVRPEDLDRALAGFLSLRDEPGSAASDPRAHGSGFDRVSSFQQGFDEGAKTCAGYRDDEPSPVELPFTDQVDKDRGGDLPYDDAVTLALADLDDYWAKAYPSVFSKPWKPLSAPKAFDPASPPTCDGSPVKDFVLFYCAPDDYVGFDNTDTMPRIYRAGGDYAVATLLATQYGLAVSHRLGTDGADDPATNLRGDCYAGAWAASVFLKNRDSAKLQLSPGDLDEALSALLLFRGESDSERQGAGFQRVKAYRKGVLTGVRACSGPLG